MKTPSSFFPGDIHSLLKSCDELLKLADVRMHYLDELPGNAGLDELLKRQDEAVMMASVLMDIHRRLTDPELLEAVTSTKPVKPRWGWGESLCFELARQNDTSSLRESTASLQQHLLSQ